MAPDEICASLDADGLRHRCDTTIAPVESRVDSSQMGHGLLAQQGTQCLTGTSTPVMRPVRSSYSNEPYQSFRMARAAAQACREANQEQSLSLHRSNRMSRSNSQSTTVLLGTGLKPPKFDGTGDVDLFTPQFEQVSAANGWDEYVSLVQLHHCLVDDVMSCGSYDDIGSTVQDLRARYGCPVKDASRKLSSIKRGSMSLHQLADEIHQLTAVVFGVGRGEAQGVELFLDLLKSGEMRGILMLTRLRSVA